MYVGQIACCGIHEHSLAGKICTVSSGVFFVIVCLSEV